MSERLRIAVVGRAGSVNVQRWCEALAGAGADIDLLSFEQWSNDLVPVHKLRGRSVPGRLGYVVGGPQVAVWCRRHRPDVLIGYFVTGYGTAASMAGWRPTVQVAAGSDILGPDPGRLKARLRRWNLARADLVLVMAPHMTRRAVGAGAEEDRVLALPHGIPVDEFQPADHRPPAPAIVSTRSLTAFYRHDMVLKALAGTPDGPPVTFVGKGPAQRPLLELVVQLGLGDRVRFVGAVANTALPGVLREHSVYVSASPTDGVSASLLEAMACGLVPVVADNDANRFWVTSGENGLLFDCTSGEDLANQLRRAVSDTALGDRCAVSNPALVRERGDIDRNAARFLGSARDLVRPGG